MKTICLKFLTLTVALSAAGLAPADTSDKDAILNQIAGYRQWTRVNHEPVEVAAAPVGQMAI